MIFALFDFLLYFFQFKRYSVANLKSKKFKLATAENFQNFNNIKIPAILFFHSRISILSWLVMYYTNSNISHTSMCLNKNEILDATTGGVMKLSIEDYLDNKSYIYVHELEVDDNKLNQMRVFANSKIGNKYNWFGVIALFLSTLFGKNKNYKIKFTLDFIILFYIMYLFKLFSLDMFYILLISMIVITVLGKILSNKSQK